MSFKWKPALDRQPDTIILRCEIAAYTIAWRQRAGKLYKYSAPLHCARTYCSENKYIFFGFISYVRNDFSCLTHETKCPTGCQIQTKTTETKTKGKKDNNKTNGGGFCSPRRAIPMDERETDCRDSYIFSFVFFYGQGNWMNGLQTHDCSQCLVQLDDIPRAETKRNTFLVSFYFVRRSLRSNEFCALSRWTISWWRTRLFSPCPSAHLWNFSLSFLFLFCLVQLNEINADIFFFLDLGTSAAVALRAEKRRSDEYPLLNI